MILHFKSIFVIVFFIIMLLDCTDINELRKEEGFTAEAQAYVDRIMEENPGATYDVEILASYANSGLGRPSAYILILSVGDKIVLTNTIDSLRVNGIYRKDKSGYGTGGGIVDLPFRGIKVASDTLDSIEIVTDSVIALEMLGLGACNLTYLPEEIMKIRTSNLDISGNYQTLEYLPNQMMQMTDPPFYWDTLLIKYDIRIANKMDSNSISDTLKVWLQEHAAPI